MTLRRLSAVVMGICICTLLISAMVFLVDLLVNNMVVSILIVMGCIVLLIRRFISVENEYEDNY